MSQTSPSSSSSDSSGSSSIEFDPVDLIPENNRSNVDTTQASTIDPGLIPRTSDLTQSQSIQKLQFPNITSSQTTNYQDQSSNKQQITRRLSYNSTTTNSLEPTGKTGTTTVASRSWMSQRKGKAIRIDGGDPTAEETGDGREDGGHSGSGTSAQRIKELAIVEHQLSSLLNLAGEAIGCLSNNLSSEREEENEEGEGAVIDQTERFSDSIVEYFETLNKIQLGLRTSMSHIRTSKISTRILFEPAHVQVKDCQVGIGGLRMSSDLLSRKIFEPHGVVKDKEINNIDTSISSRTLERDAWLDLIDSLEKLLYT
ncbi:hypothetical protein PPACK8108_LOCUS5511 [Phakopsora pachyrhizi]|uniref:Mediator of RNA polymerase II transcription subunit 11 n=1 Tax=Phakopsora pachyrhizi TaxID=170000 RepID=A0AAV0AP76_PHAPC|nr:hypothetical protein PPACK8108_LOCUS5511 [Phakopsora pachyrhizi]